MSPLPSLFETFLANIRPQAEHREAYKEGHETLRDRLQSFDEFEGVYVADFLQGSYRRWTALKPQEGEKSDVDVVFVTSLDKEAVEAEDALKVCEPFLEEHYEDQWSPNAHSYKINQEAVEIDLVLTAAPSEATMGAIKALGSLEVGAALTADEFTEVAAALEMSPAGDDAWKDDPLDIPDRDENVWEKTHPLATIDFTVRKNDKTDGHYVNVVKAIKWWRRTQTQTDDGPTSYPLEHLVGACCPDSIDSVAEGVTRTFEEIERRFATAAANEQTPNLPAHGLPPTPETNVLHYIEGEAFAAFHHEVSTAAERARTALDEDDDATAREHWSDLFGEEFPEYGSDDDSDSGSDKGMALGSSSEAPGASSHQFG